MGRKKRLLKNGQDLTLRIDRMAFGGKGIAKMPTDEGDFTVFVANTVPGQLVKAKVSKCKKNYAECKLMEVLERAEVEQEIPYQHIPGAPYACVPIEEQCRMKQETTFALFERISGLSDVRERFDQYLESPSVWHYRNKMEYSFSAIGYDLKLKRDVDEFSLGFKHRGTWWMVENLDADSGLFDRDVESSMQGLREWFIETGLPAWHPPRKEGFYRHLVVRKSYYKNQLLFNLVTSSDGLESFDREAFLDELKNHFGQRLGGVLHTLNDQVGDRIDPVAGQVELLYGQPTLIEQINGLEFEISMSSFFQTNPKCAEILYNKVFDYVNEGTADDAVVMDLFCGTGTIAQLLASKSNQQVIGVDIVESAIDNARANASRNQVNNVEFYAADVGKFLLEYPEYAGKIDTIVLDPPRAGISPKALKRVIELGAQRIVYVSCNPATQARDTEQLMAAGYRMEKLTFVDQFPHTSHIESIALFSR